MTEEYKNFLKDQVQQGLDDIEKGQVISLEESRQLCEKVLGELFIQKMAKQCK